MDLATPLARFAQVVLVPFLILLAARRLPRDLPEWIRRLPIGLSRAVLVSYLISLLLFCRFRPSGSFCPRGRIRFLDRSSQSLIIPYCLELRSDRLVWYEHGQIVLPDNARFRAIRRTSGDWPGSFYRTINCLRRSRSLLSPAGSNPVASSLETSLR